MIRGSISWTDKKVVVIILIVLFIGLYIGSSIGSYLTIKAVARIGVGFIDEGLIKQAIYQYEHYIHDCFPANWSV